MPALVREMSFRINAESNSSWGYFLAYEARSVVFLEIAFLAKNSATPAAGTHETAQTASF